MKSNPPRATESPSLHCGYPSHVGISAPCPDSSECLGIESWQELAQRLRHEIAEFGQLLSLFEEQQRMILRGSPECALEAGKAIEIHIRTLRQDRDSREKAFAAVARANGAPSNASVRSLLQFFPAETRPLFRALATEISLLVHRARRHHSRNRSLLHWRGTVKRHAAKATFREDFFQLPSEN